jgi:hypothetical protein
MPRSIISSRGLCARVGAGASTVTAAISMTSAYCILIFMNFRKKG